VAWSFHRERVLFRTHQPPSGAPDKAAGALVEFKGGLYRVTRWRELPLVPLDRGGSTREWEVLGRKASSKQIRDDLARDAQSLLQRKDLKE
jgi:hypothetical protein